MKVTIYNVLNTFRKKKFSPQTIQKILLQIILSVLVKLMKNHVLNPVALAL